MQIETTDGIKLVYKSDEAETAGWITGTIADAIRQAQDLWGLAPPQNCWVYVMTSPVGFVFQSAPWVYRLGLGLTIPFWLGRIQRAWPISAAWTQRYGQRVAIGVKPARLLEPDERALEIRQRIGGRMYVEENDPWLKVRQVTCHELVHACSTRLNLPPWLNEGIATVTVDRLLGKPTIRHETLTYMRNYEPKGPPPSYRDLARMDGEAIVYNGVRGYWLVRYLEAEQTGFLKLLFERQPDKGEIEAAVIQKLPIDTERFWQEIDSRLAEYFEGP